MLELLQKVDANILKLIHECTQNYVFDKVMPVITSIGNMGIIWIIISVALILNKKYRTIGLMCISALVFESIVGDVILKHLVQRPRPFVSMPTIHLLIDKPTSFSFPSGHTSAAFAVVGIIWSQLKRYRMPVLVLASLIAFSRVYLCVHYPFDVLAGIVQGLVCAKIVLRYYPQAVEKNASTYISGT